MSLVAEKNSDNVLRNLTFSVAVPLSSHAHVNSPSRKTVLHNSGVVCRFGGKSNLGTAKVFSKDNGTAIQAARDIRDTLKEAKVTKSKVAEISDVSPDESVEVEPPFFSHEGDCKNVLQVREYHEKVVASNNRKLARLSAENRKLSLESRSLSEKYEHLVESAQAAAARSEQQLNAIRDHHGNDQSSKEVRSKEELLVAKSSRRVEWSKEEEHLISTELSAFQNKLNQLHMCLAAQLDQTFSARDGPSLSVMMGEIERLSTVAQTVGDTILTTTRDCTKQIQVVLDSFSSTNDTNGD